MEIVLLIDPSLPDSIPAATTLYHFFTHHHPDSSITAAVLYAECDPKYLTPAPMPEFLCKLAKLLQTRGPALRDWTPIKQRFVELWERVTQRNILQIHRHENRRRLPQPWHQYPVHTKSIWSKQDLHTQEWQCCLHHPVKQRIWKPGNSPRNSTPSSRWFRVQVHFCRKPLAIILQIIQ